MKKISRSLLLTSLEKMSAVTFRGRSVSIPELVLSLESLLNPVLKMLKMLKAEA